MCYKTAIIYPDGTWSVVATNTTAKNCDCSHKFYERYCVQQLLKANGRDFLFSMHRFSFLVDTAGVYRNMIGSTFRQLGEVSARHETVCFDSDRRSLFCVVSYIEAGHDN